MTQARQVAGPNPARDVVQQRRRIRRNTILLAFVAVSIYVAFIASGVLNAQP
jgi:hypothetical protein